ncbi:MAG TPA: ROK family protein [Agriterribacter sp.]|nr:ROK family protein [Agriterribacter sp.]
MKKGTAAKKILSIDIGGSSIKATVLNEEGVLLQDFQKVKTPKPAHPEQVLEAIRNLVTGFKQYDCVSVGFPGYVKKGIVHTAPNLGTEFWKNINLNILISEMLDKPVRIVNDADLHGLGVVSEKGLELVITLGTGFGTALLWNGELLPHLELAHHPVTKSKTYDQYIGDIALENAGLEKWNTRIQSVIHNLKVVFNYDRLYIGGGNAKKINFPLDEDIIIINNEDGIRGGARLWKLDNRYFFEGTAS